MFIRFAVCCCIQLLELILKRMSNTYAIGTKGKRTVNENIHVFGVRQNDSFFALRFSTKTKYLCNNMLHDPWFHRFGWRWQHTINSHLWLKYLKMPLEIRTKDKRRIWKSFSGFLSSFLLRCCCCVFLFYCFDCVSVHSAHVDCIVMFQLGKN